MSRALSAIAAEAWAITPDWLQVIAALAMRAADHPAVLMAREQTGYQPGVERAQLPGGYRHAVNQAQDTYFFGAAATRMPGGSGKATMMDGVALIPMLGPIFPRANMMTDISGATSLTDMQRDLRAALENQDINSILLCVDSPGGAVSGIAAMADTLHAAGKVKPLGAHVSGTGASAAYWLASATQHISVDRTAAVGSIGVVVAMPKQVAPDKNGDMTVEIVSTNAPNKRLDPASGPGYAEIQSRLDAIEAQFVGDVARGRGVDVKTVTSDFGRGGVLIGKEAVKVKMADSVSSIDAAVARMARIGKLSRNQRQAGG